MTILNSDKIDITRYLKDATTYTAVTSGTKIADLVKTKRARRPKEDSVVYKIQCGSCERSNHGETFIIIIVLRHFYMHTHVRWLLVDDWSPRCMTPSVCSS